MKKLFLILFLLLSGCARYTNNYDLYLDPALGNQLNPTETAAEDWENKSGVHFNIFIENKVCDNNCSDTITIHPNTIASVREMSGTNCIGYTSRHRIENYANIFLGEDVSTDEESSAQEKRDTMVRHEIGHALGLEHDVAGTVMFPHMGMEISKHVTCRDARQYADLRLRPVPLNCLNGN